MGKAVTQSQFPQDSALSFDPQAFDDAIRSQGIQLVHHRAMRCPVGMIDQYDSRRPHDDHSGCSNGFIYSAAGTITCLFTGVTNELKQQDVGLQDGSTVQVTAPRYYDDEEGFEGEEEVQIAPFDRLYLKQEAVTVPHWQLATAHITGREKLSFPLVSVIDVMDARGRRYSPGEYRIEDGQLVWTGQGPGLDPNSDKGTVFAIRYTYRPYFYVSRVMHQVRVAQVETMIERMVMRMPQSFLLSREYVYENEQKDETAVDPTSSRQMKAPATGRFGPR